LSKPVSIKTPERFQWLIPPEFAGTVRADSLLKRCLPTLSQRSRKELFLNKGVRINGRPVSKGFKASPGDKLEIECPGPLDPFQNPAQEARPLIAYEDQALLIVVKPGLIHTHPLNHFERGTMVQTLAAYWPRILKVGNKPLEPGLVHRLDHGTSGLLAVALTPQAWVRLKKDLAAGKWRKTYRALVSGVISETLTLSRPLAHDPQDERKMKVLQGSGDPRRGRAYKAITTIRPLTRYPKATLVDIDLITGVMHQIRVHLSAQGHPLIGDALYGSPYGQELGLPPGRFFLHASELSLPHPITRKPITLFAEIPEDLQKVLNAFV
jgi:23S rRNA pseudouridine1911/1915/1917 synthase